MEWVSWRRVSAEDRFDIEVERVWRREEVELVMLSSSAGERRGSFSLDLEELECAVEGELRCLGLLVAEWVEMLR